MRRRRDQGRPHRLRRAQPRPRTASKVVDAKGLAVAPGFINMLSWATESLLVDGLGQSDLRQGVTLEVMGEGWSMGPLNDQMKKLAVAAAGRLQISDRMDHARRISQLPRERRGTSMNVASFVGATTVRQHELGEGDVDPTPEQLGRMRALGPPGDGGGRARRRHVR